MRGAEEDAPVAGSEVWARGPESVELIGYSDDLGTLVVEHPAGIFTFSASRPDYQSAPLTVDTSQVSEIELVLREHGVLSGTLTLASAPPKENVTVVAIPVRLSRSLTRSPPDVALRAPETRVVAATDGAFSFSDLTAGEEYQLFAGGEGLIQTAARVVAQPGETVVIELAYAYATLVVFVDENGDEVRSRRCSGSGGSTQAQLHASGGGFSKASSLCAYLAGVDVTLQNDALTRRLFIGESTLPLNELGPVNLSGRFFGYEPFQDAFHLNALKRGVDTFKCVVHSATSGWGRIDIQFSHHLGPGDPLAEQFFLHVNGPAGTVKYPFALGPDGGATVEPIPVGAYRVSVSGLGHFRYPLEGDLDLSVSAAGTDLEVDSRHTGGVELDVRNGDGSPYLGEIRAMVGRANPAPSQNPHFPDGTKMLRGSFVSFSKVPVIIDCLPAGVHDVMITEPKVDGGVRGVDVHAGQASVETFDVK